MTKKRNEPAKAPETGVAPQVSGEGETATPTNEPSSSTNPASREAGDPEATLEQRADVNNDGTVSDVEAAVAPVLENAAPEAKPELERRLQTALGSAGETPQPTMVNGRSVVGKKYNPDTDTWDDDPDYAGGSGARQADIFDRIGNAFMHEGQRQVLEEIARAAGLTSENTRALVDGTPAVKSTASLRTDVSGYGGYAAGGPGPRPVGPDKDGQPVEELDAGQAGS